ncbi:protoporphyrinogen oxidase [Rubeoparvulum massiliense]|uniref:protoporphyrinogen oxidase n=1 Tax=Rubeoparvulum massiliense TaxID=1631346 RepID=UPI00065DCFC3|nr:protoporphyrinogen oxidase [Rubeoparvulum massiliense]
MKHVAIIGGGITGLTVAYLLEQQKQEHPDELDYQLIEKEERLGGKVITENVDGFIIEGGPDSFISRKPEVMKISEQLGISANVMGTNTTHRGSYVLSDNQIHQLPDGVALLMPFKIMDFARNPIISWRGKFRALGDLFIPARPNQQDESLASFINRRLGNEMLEKLIGPLVGGIHSNNPNSMSLQATFPRFLEMEREHRSIILAILHMKRAMKKRMKQVNPASTNRKPPFLTFQHGMTELTSALEKALSPDSIHTGTAVARIEKGEQTPYRIFLQNGEEINADAVVVTAGANIATKLLNGIDEELAQLLGKIPFTSSAAISLGYRKADLPQLPLGYGITIPVREQRNISAITFSSLKWDHRVPNDDYMLLRIFIGGYANPELVQRDNEHILDIIKMELNDILGITADPVVQRIYRWVQGRPQYELGHLDCVHQIEARLQDHPGLYVAGSSFYGAGLSDCIASAVRGTNTILKELGIESNN